MKRPRIGPGLVRCACLPGIGLRRLLLYRRAGWRNALTLARLLVGWTGPEVCLRHPGRDGRLYLRARTTDRRVFEDIFLRGYYDVELPFDPVFVVDAGANVGLASRYFAERFPSCSIVAVEPEQGNFEQLRKNTAVYGARFRAIRAGLWWRPGFLRVQPSHNRWSGAWDFTVAECAEGAPGAVTAVTMGELASGSPTGRVDLCKMDIEGSESEVLSRESADWLQRTRALIVELHGRPNVDVGAATRQVLSPFMFTAGRVGESHVFLNHRWESMP